MTPTHKSTTQATAGSKTTLRSEEDPLTPPSCPLEKVPYAFEPMGSMVSRNQLSPLSSLCDLSHLRRKYAPSEVCRICSELHVTLQRNFLGAQAVSLFLGRSEVSRDACAHTSCPNSLNNAISDSPGNVPRNSKALLPEQHWEAKRRDKHENPCPCQALPRK